MGFRQTIESFWVKSRSTILWPLHRPGPSKIKGERGGKSVIKSETFSVNFPLCHYCTCTHTHSDACVRACAHTNTHTVDPHPSCTGGHDLMYQYWERNEAEDAWPRKAAADQLKLCRVYWLKMMYLRRRLKDLKARLLLLIRGESGNWQHVDSHMHGGIWFYVWMQKVEICFWHQGE